VTSTTFLTSSSFTTSPIVKVIVGEERKIYHFHEALLVEKSSFFEACLSSGMIEQQNDEIVLPEDPCTGFNIIAHWIYYGEFKTIPHNFELLPLLEAWVMADKYSLSDLQNDIIEQLKAYWQARHVHPKWLLWLMENTLETSTIYRLTFDQLVWNMVKSPHCYDPDSQSSDDSFLVQLKEVLARKDISLKLLWQFKRLDPQSDVPAEEEGCLYHVHDQGKGCNVQVITEGVKSILD
jgi:hypothetical protein